MCSIWQAVALIFKVYMAIMLIYAVLSWVPSLRGRWTEYIARLVEPVLIPVRRVIPPLGGLDLSFLVVLIVLQVVLSTIVVPQLGNACFLSY